MGVINLRLGVTSEGRVLYYPLDNRSDNNSMLLLGRSGSGKSTAISLFEKQVGTYGKKVIELDFSDSSIIDDNLGNYCRVIDVKNSDKFSPLARQYNVYGSSESDMNFARRIADLITVAIRLGARQKEALYNTIKAVAQEKNAITFGDICRGLEREEQPQESILARLKYFAEAHVFAVQEGSDWNEIFSHPRQIQVLSLAGFPVSYRSIVAELLLADLQNYLIQSGPGSLDFILVLDECQNLRLLPGMPTAFFLSQGRKYGCGTWLATQSPENFEREELAQLYQPALVLNFQPNGAERSKICRKLAKNERERIKLLQMCEELCRGYFIASGRFIRTDGRVSDYGHLLAGNI